MRSDRSSPMSQMQTVVLSNGQEIFCFNGTETAWVHEEVKGYLKHGITLRPGDTVFDVGANIGVFTLYLNQVLQNDVTVYAFEPVPAIFKVLQQNFQRYNPQGLKAFCCGLAQETKIVQFDFYPEATTISSASTHPSQGMQNLVRDALLRHPEHTPFPVNALRWVPVRWRAWVFDRFSKDYFRVEQVTCQLRTLSEIVREQQVQQIDLLKIDVEKSEMDVLLGIEEQDWQKIQQVVIEVHDIDNRLDDIISLFKDHGLGQVTVEQEPLFEGSETFNVYAVRSNKPALTPPLL